jgi:hypothetical protein
MPSNLYLFAYTIVKVLLATGLGPTIVLACVAKNAARFAESKTGQLYIYRWKRYLGMPVLGGERKGQECKVLVRGARNSCLIEFPGGFKAVTSRNALRKVL